MARARCLAMGPRECSAVLVVPEVASTAEPNHRRAMATPLRVPRRCLALKPLPGVRLHLRGRGAGLFEQARKHLDAGERLLREYMMRHGLLSAVVATSLPPLVPAVARHSLGPCTGSRFSSSEARGQTAPKPERCPGSHRWAVPEPHTLAPLRGMTGVSYFILNVRSKPTCFNGFF